METYATVKMAYKETCPTFKVAYEETWATVKVAFEETCAIQLMSKIMRKESQNTH